AAAVGDYRGRQVAVVIHVTLEAGAAAAVFDRILLAVHFELSNRTPVGIRQGEIPAVGCSIARDLPAADYAVQLGAYAAGELLSAPKGEVIQVVEANVVLGYVG